MSDAEWDDLSAQCADAVAYIEQHEEDLLRLRAMPEVDDMRLDFPIERRDVFVQCDYFPPALVRAAGHVGLGIELSVYPCADDEAEDDDVETAAPEPTSRSGPATGATPAKNMAHGRGHVRGKAPPDKALHPTPPSVAGAP